MKILNKLKKINNEIIWGIKSVNWKWKKTISEIELNETLLNKKTN